MCGSCKPGPAIVTWCSSQRCIDHPKYHFVIAYGVSKNRRARWDNANVSFLGLSAAGRRGGLRPTDLVEGCKKQFHGGPQRAMEFSSIPLADRLKNTRKHSG
jgi:uronate dehydrogenase